MGRPAHPESERLRQELRALARFETWLTPHLQGISNMKRWASQFNEQHSPDVKMRMHRVEGGWLFVRIK